MITSAVINLVGNIFVSSNVTNEDTEAVSSYVANIENIAQDLIVLIKESVTSSEQINAFIRSTDRSFENIFSFLQNVLNRSKGFVTIAEAVVCPTENCRNSAERALLLCQDLADSAKTDNIAIYSLENPRGITTLVRTPEIFALFPIPGLDWRFAIVTPPPKKKII
ncbi:hypothetical protein BDF21DRAFT_449261 [Thamnidium elegans]|nr:hypothetical protein BDF21DRAFT_449261 [Thamnidium elegans]